MDQAPDETAGASAPADFVPFDDIITHRTHQFQLAQICGHICLNRYQEGLGRLEVEHHQGETLVICGGGPSIRDQVALVRALGDMGARVIATNDCARYLIDQGVKLHGWMYFETALLPDDHRWFRDPPTDIPLYLASHCHPNVVDKFQQLGCPIVLWHCYQNELTQQLFGSFYPGQPVIGGGCSAALRMMNIGTMLWGYRTVRLFGLDSSHGETTHAYYDEPVHRKGTIPIEAFGRMFDSTIYLAKQARDFMSQMKVYAAMPNGGPDITVHGDGLLPWCARHLDR